MSQQAKSCAAAYPIQRNNATAQNSATGNATNTDEISRKPASILELRAQLRAQQQRNDSKPEIERVAQKVAHGLPETPEEWIAMIKELDAAIEEFCARFELDADAQSRIVDARFSQPLTSIPECLAWFNNKLSA